MPTRRRYRDEIALAPGETIPESGRYRIERLIGSGTFALVYLAFRDDGAKVAIKEFRIPGDPRQKEDFQHLFEQEREVLRRMGSHPLVPDYLEDFQFDGRNYLLQEYVEGPSLADILERGERVPETQIITWALKLCEGAVYLQEHGIIHHDLKPENIEITADGTPVILDMGSAHVPGGRQSDFYGSDGYMAPEIREMLKQGDLEAHRRIDVFALGCILYEMMLGRRPTQDDIDMRSGRLVGPLLRELSDMHPGLVSVLVKALSFDRGYRYQSARELLDDLQAKGPPALVLSQTAIRFGEVSGRGHERRTIIASNHGAQTPEGKVRVRHDWLRVAVSDAPDEREVEFSADEVPITVTAYPERIQERGVEITADMEVTYQMGKIVVPCTITVVPQRATLQVSQASLYVSVQLGKQQQVQVGVRNVGEQGADVACTISGPEGVSVAPQALHLEPLESGAVMVTADGQRLKKGSHAARLTFQAQGGHEAQANLTVDVFGSIYDTLRARMAARRSRTS
ncbi:MAG: serine/threonine protein kinase [Armatimonadota bacterium]|nr:MAG: serine/threonine protein kinase [Armatimonadota bacterium]